MTSHRLLSVYMLIFIALLSFLIGVGQAMITNLTVKGGAEVTHPINLIVEDHVFIQFTAAGTLQFFIVFPNETVRDFGEVGKASYSFICELEGEYMLHFVNNEQTENKLVTLNYEVQHYVFGIPQMLFMTLFIVLVCIGGVAAFVLLGKTYR